MAVWLVRAGSRGERQDYALDNSVVVIGWDGCPDLSSLKTKQELRGMYERQQPGRSVAYISNHVGQLWAFASRMRVGDLVALPLKGQDAIAFGEVAGDYAYCGDNPSGTKHVRPVRWINQEFPRNRLDQDILYSLGAFMTVCQIKRNDAERRIRALLTGKAPEPKSEVVDGTDQDDEAADTSASPNLDEYAETQIRTYITQKFAGHKLGDVVEAIFQVQGYQTIKSEPGPDGGVDIVAGRGPLGFDPPRLCVQVKSGSSTQDIKVLRELKGVMKDFNADQGLFVSWGGFKRTILQEVRRHFFEIRLWDASD